MHLTMNRIKFPLEYLQGGSANSGEINMFLEEIEKVPYYCSTI